MARSVRLLAATALLLGLALQPAAGQVPADTPTAEAAAPAERLAPADVQGRIEAVEPADLDEETRARLLETYREALSLVQQAEAQRAEAAGHRAEAEAAPDLLSEIRARIDRPADEPAPQPPSGAKLGELEQELARAEARLAAAQETHTRLEAEPKRRTDRRIEAPKLLSEARQELERAEAELAAQPPEAPSEAERARRMLLRARAQELRARIAALEAELASYDARRDLLTARRELAARELVQAQKAVEAWRALVTDRRQQEGQQAVEEARRASRQVHPALRELAEENQRLAEMRTGSEGLTAGLTRASSELQRASEKLAALQLDLTRTRDRVETVGLTRTMGVLLRKKRAELPDVHDYERSIQVREERIGEVRNAWLDLQDRWADLADTDARAEEAVAAVRGRIAPEERDDVRQSARELLAARRELLDRLVRDYESYFITLVNLNTTEGQTVSVARQYARYIDEKVLWFRSTAPLHWRDAPALWRALRWLLAPDAWYSVLEALLADARGQLLLYGAAVLALALLLRAKAKLRARVRQVGELTRSASTDSFALTLSALALTLLTAGIAPLLMWFVGWRVASPLEAGDFARAVGGALVGTAPVYLTLELLRQMCREDGLADAHFRWPERSRRTLRLASSGLIAVGLPLLFVVLLAGWDFNQPHNDSLGRLAFIALMVVVAVFVWRVLSPHRGIVQPAIERHPGGWLDRLSFLWFGLSVGAPVAWAVAAAAGFLYTARELATRLLWSLWLAVLLLVLYELMMRWLFVARRRLALERARKRREAQQAEEAEPEAAPPPEEPEVSLRDMGAQTRQLSLSLVLVALAAGLYLVWSGVLPALGVLDEVLIWGGVSLADVGRAVLIIVVTVVAARNIPGLLEITVLQRLPLEPGVRFAITTIGRYVLIFVGVVLTAGAVNVGWEKVQWLAAALTVGLGFGLQEIFANFVSGIIILVERPMRVGDVVTVGDVTGTVARIRMRATTITDWDRKELVVPNREFITGRLINWTLSDRVLRLVVPVGIAYGSDTEKARDVLLRVARKHPDVLDEPEPQALFLGFGNSSLNFELRAFIPSVDVRLRVQSELHMQIDRAFREAGITIAFPQLDLHVESIEAPLRVARQRGSEPEGSEQT